MNYKKYIPAFLMIVTLFLTGCKSERGGAAPTVWITSDVHYLSSRLSDGGEAYQSYMNAPDGKQLKYSNPLMDAFVYQIKKAKPDLLIISGDLTNNGEKYSHEDLADKLHNIQKSGTHVLVIPGNHDISNPWARSFKEEKQYLADTVDENEFRKIYDDYGYQDAVSRDETTLSYLSAPFEDLWFLMIDSNKYKNNMTLGFPETNGVLSKSTLEWMKKCSGLAKEKGATLITVMHHNMLHHSDLLQEGFTLDNQGQVLPRLKEDNINLVFSGHIHIQDISSDQKGDVPFYDVASGAFSVYPHQYGVLTLNRTQNQLNYHTSLLDVETWARKKHKKDANLLNFSSYDRDYFGNLSYQRTLRNLAGETQFSEEEIREMAQTMKILNLRYFAGTEKLNEQDVLSSRGYELLTRLSDNFTMVYAKSIVTDQDTDDNRLIIQLPVRKE